MHKTTNHKTTNQMSFLPDNYEPPAAPSRYLKLQPGKTKFRILASPILGTVGWHETEEGRRPVRVRTNELLPKDCEEGKHFWAMPVLDYDDHDIKILEITQATVQRAIRDCAEDADWGNPTGYDITVERTGEGMKTKYSVRPHPPTDLPAQVVADYEALNLDLEALYEGGDPFANASHEADENPF